MLTLRVNDDADPDLSGWSRYCYRLQTPVAHGGTRIISATGGRELGWSVSVPLQDQVHPLG